MKSIFKRISITFLSQERLKISLTLVGLCEYYCKFQCVSDFLTQIGYTRKKDAK